MTERPILFSTAMVEAILDERKTQTRRIMRPQPVPDTAHPKAVLHLDPFETTKGLHFRERTTLHLELVGETIAGPRESMGDWHTPPAQPGDLLWVRETWRPVERRDDDILVRYRAGDVERWTPGTWAGKDGVDRPLRDQWYPGIHMPRWACRLVLEVEDVRAEPLAAISTANIEAEGVDLDDLKTTTDPQYTARSRWVDLWDGINGTRHDGAYAWARNPWVWVLTFKLQEHPCTTE